MILLLIVLCIVLFAIGVYLDDKFCLDGTSVTICVVSAFGLLVSIIVYIGVFFCFMDTLGATEKLTIYQEENKTIVEQVNQSVNSYMEFEKETYSNLKLDNPTFIVSMYPELKSNELVSKQLDIYISNQDKIKKCREKIVMNKIYRKLLFVF